MHETQVLLVALFGALLGGAVVLAWRVSERERNERPQPEPVLPEGVATVLSVLRSSALVVDADDHVLRATAPVYAMHLLNDDRLTDPDLLGVVRKVRRDGQIRDETITRARGLGTPDHTLTARVAPLGSRLVLVLLEDVTRERQVEAIRRDFVANVSHELKTPVGAIRLLSDAVNDASDDPEAVQRFAGRMATESQRLGRLVQQIIELSRLQDDDPLEDPIAIDVDALLERVVDENKVEATASDIALVRDGVPDLKVLGSREQTALAVGNLVSNAISYSPPGSSVVINTRDRPETVEISVSDQGIGIPANEIDRIFERFYRVDPARHRSTGGTGLGLSIVKHVAASHGGEVKVWSVEGQGSTFTLILPRKIERRTEEEAS